MDLQTKIPLQKAQRPIDYESQLFLLGSCFSTHIGNKLDYFKFQTLQNPFGILFHPLAIENLIQRAVHQKNYTQEELFFLNERWHCFDAHSELSDTSKEGLLAKLNTALEQTRNQIEKSTHIGITLGTAWVYEKKETKAIVANCHRVPQSDFTKRLLSVDAIFNSLNKVAATIEKINPNVFYIVTVSPVRHLKNGFIENQRSKAHLIAAVHNWQQTHANTSYFPSYEILMDELRDYRFYKSDMIHPNALGVDYIWEKFSAVYFSEETAAVMKKVDDVQKSLQHRPFNPKSEQHQQFLKAIAAKITYLQNKYPFMKFA